MQTATRLGQLATPAREVEPSSTGQEPSSTDRTLPPRVVGLVGLAIGIGILVAATLERRLSTDVFWSLAAGQWMLAHHRIVGLDPFSYTESHRHWVADEWGSEVVLASLYKVFGVAAYNLFSIATGSLCLVCSMLYARAVGARGGRLAVLMILLALGIVPFVTQDRGLSFSLIWLPLELLILTKARETPRLLWWLPLLGLAWVNTHGSILIGLVVIGVELAWSLAPQRLMNSVHGLGSSTHRRALALALLGTALASCISPYGPALLTYDLGVARNSQIGQYILEWMSPDFHSIEMILFFCLPLAAAFIAVRRHRVMVLEMTLTAAFFVAGLHSVRFAVYLMIAAVGVAAGLPARPIWSARAQRVTGALAIGAIVAICAVPSVPSGSVTADTPVQAFNFLAAHPGRIFTEYTWGDYSIARGRPTFVDGRTDLFVGNVLTEFFAVDNLTANPDPILSRYHVDYVIWSRNSALGVYLSHDSRWEIVDRTSPAIVFARRSTWTGQRSSA